MYFCYQSFSFPMNPGLLQSWITFKVGKVCSAQAGKRRGIKLPLFTHSYLFAQQGKQADLSPLALLLPSFPFVFNFAFFRKKLQFHFMFGILNVMCGGYCHLMNVLSAGPSSLILIHFRGSMPLWLGQKNAFNIEIV